MTLLFPAKGFDVYSGELTVLQRQEAKNLGMDFIIHYYGGSSGKDLTAEELELNSKLGIYSGSVFEGGGDRIANFSTIMGIHDAQEALAQAVKAGQPKGSCIYFAYDLDPPVQSFTNNIGPYATQAATLVRAAGYRVGAYGAGATLSYLFAKGLIDYDWVGGAMGWQGSRGYKRADGSQPSLIQGLPTNMGIIGDVDPDTALRDAGLFIFS